MPDQDPFTDHAAPILAGDPSLSDENRAELWDIFHGSKSPEELVQKLQVLAVPDDTKKRLYDEKKLTVPPTVEPISRIATAITQMTQMDPKALDVAESHPTVFKTLTAALTAPEKGADSVSGGTSGAGQGKQPSKDKKTVPLALPARVDGLEHLPPISDGMKRVLASDGGIHDLPEENVAKAFEIDPRLHVLNP